MSTARQPRFAVHRIDEAPSRAHLVEGSSFQDAALNFVEDRHLDPAGADVSLMVEDRETGERQCFRVDVSAGAAAPCD